ERAPRRRPRPRPAAQGAPAPALHGVDAAPDPRGAGLPLGRTPAAVAAVGATAGADRRREPRLVPVPAALRLGPVGAAHRGRRTPAAARGGRGRGPRGVRLARDAG